MMTVVNNSLVRNENGQASIFFVSPGVRTGWANRLVVPVPGSDHAADFVIHTITSFRVPFIFDFAP